MVISGIREIRMMRYELLRLTWQKLGTAGLLNDPDLSIERADIASAR